MYALIVVLSLSLFLPLLHTLQITTLSLMHAVVIAILHIYYNPTLSESVPNWVYFTGAYMLFMYQVMYYCICAL
jgi:hypothetical protein